MNKNVKVEAKQVRCGRCGCVGLFGKGEPWICRFCGYAAEGGK